MSIVITDVRLQGSNPGPSNSTFEFEIDFECASPGLQCELEFKVVYVPDPDDPKNDQLLDCVSVGPVAIGKNSFRLSAEKLVDFSRIKSADVFETTAIFVSCCYRDTEFCRVGYYVSHLYQEQPTTNGQVQEKIITKCDAPKIVNWEKLLRSVTVDKPRITIFPIGWDNVANTTNDNSGVTSEFKMSPEDIERANAAAAVVDYNSDMDNGNDGNMDIESSTESASDSENL
jgi:histone chaperone ASF1